MQRSRAVAHATPVAHTAYVMPAFFADVQPSGAGSAHVPQLAHVSEGRGVKMPAGMQLGALWMRMRPTPPPPPPPPP